MSGLAAGLRFSLYGSIFFVDGETPLIVLDRPGDSHHDWVGALSRLGGLAMALRRLATTAATCDFQRLAFDALRAELAFDSGIWTTGVMDPELSLHSLFPYHQPPGTMPAWQAVAEHDTLLAETLRHPGQTLRATADGPEGGLPFLPEVRNHAYRSGMGQVLGTSYIDPALGLVEGFALYRAKAAPHFTEPERLLAQHALPHLSEAWRINRLRPLREELPSSAPARAPLDGLTHREKDIARRFGQGMNYREIAAELHISPATVRNHLANTYGKLGVSNKIALAKLFA